MANPIEIKKLNLEKLLNFIERNNVCIPEFQRGYVWKTKQVRDLFDSLIKKYPIGSFILWRTNQKIGRRNIFSNKQKESRDKLLILDGQQRILSIYYLCKQNKFLETKDLFQEIYENRGKNIIDFERFYFEKKQRPELNYSKDKFCAFDVKEFKKRLNNYLFPVIIVSIDEYSKAIEIFERINQFGTKIATEAIFLSEAWNKKTSLGQILRKWKDKRRNKLTGNLDSIIYIHTLAIVIQLEDKIKNVDITLRTLKKIAERIKEDKKRNYERIFKEVLDAITESLSFLAKEYGIKKINELPSQTMVTVLSVFFYYFNTLTRRQREELKKWFWRSSLNSRYVGSGYNENITTDAIKMKNLAKNNEKLSIPPKDIYFEDFSEIDIRTGRSTLRNAIKLMLWNREPRWINGEGINREEAESIKKKKEDDHFYPHYFYKQGFINEDINNILNLCFLPKEENVKKLKYLPSEWLESRKKELSPKVEDEKQFFLSNLLPFKSIKDLKEKEISLYAKNKKIKVSQLKKYYEKFRRKRFDLFRKELHHLQRGR